MKLESARSFSREYNFLSLVAEIPAAANQVIFQARRVRHVLKEKRRT